MKGQLLFSICTKNKFHTKSDFTPRTLVYTIMVSVYLRQFSMSNSNKIIIADTVAPVANMHIHDTYVGRRA